MRKVEERKKIQQIVMEFSDKKFSSEMRKKILIN